MFNSWPALLCSVLGDEEHKLNIYSLCVKMWVVLGAAPKKMCNWEAKYSHSLPHHHNVSTEFIIIIINRSQLNNDDDHVVKC